MALKVTECLLRRADRDGVERHQTRGSISGGASAAATSIIPGRHPGSEQAKWSKTVAGIRLQRTSSSSSSWGRERRPPTYIAGALQLCSDSRQQDTSRQQPDGPRGVTASLSHHGCSGPCKLTEADTQDSLLFYELVHFGAQYPPWQRF